MTPADLARANAVSFECKKDALQQRQSGDWKISFTVQGVDMDERITRAAMGTRFVAVLVEINDQELPVPPVAKEIKPISPVTPRPVTPDKPLVEAKRTWEQFQPSQQAGIRSHDVRFAQFLEEEYVVFWDKFPDAAQCIRAICDVNSRAQLGTDHSKRVLWNHLDKHFQAWEAKIRMNA
jgi:hypothetical protein